MEVSSPVPSGSKRGLEEAISAEASPKVAKTGELIDIDSYFYGALPGDANVNKKYLIHKENYYATKYLISFFQVLSQEFKADMAFKCHICKKLYMNNIEFMKHLSLHVERERSSAVDLADICQCKYCFKEFDDQYNLQQHLDGSHLMSAKFDYGCKICESVFNAKEALISHMHKTHIRAELPYGCALCGFRSSFHRALVEHFQEAHDRTDKLQCPHCLKIFALYSEKGYNSTMATSFVQHIQVHVDKNIKCRKCVLSFQTDVALRSHLEKDHLSYKLFDLEPQMSETGAVIQMMKPDEKGLKQAAKRPLFTKPPKQQSAFAAQNLEDLAMYDVETEDCGECGKKIVTPGHFT